MERTQDDPQPFTDLEDRLAMAEPKDVLKVKRDRWVIAVMLAGMAMTVPSIAGAKGELIGWLTLLGLVLELCGLGVLTYRQIRDSAPDFVDAKRNFAVELDAHFGTNQRLLDWLRSSPLPERNRRLAYIESRLESMSSRYQIAFGAVDKLGILPLLAGIFVQVQAIRSVSGMTGLFAFAILALYGMAIWMARFRLQLQSYARLLSKKGVRFIYSYLTSAARAPDFDGSVCQCFQKRVRFQNRVRFIYPFATDDFAADALAGVSSRFVHQHVGKQLASAGQQVCSSCR